MSLKLRRGNTAQRLAITPDEGELIYDSQTKQLYAGDGTTAGGVLVSYAGSVGGAMGSNLVLSGYSVTGSGNIDIAGTITSTGNIVSTNGDIRVINGNFVANGNIVLGDTNTDNVTIGADVNSNIIPNADITFDLGSSTQRWNTVHANNVFADLEGNVRANDSTILVDAVNGVLKGQLEGNLIGPVQGAVEGNVTGDLTGNLKNENGTTILSNGSDTIPAEFIGNVTGNLTGTIENGVLTTEFYSNPSWITALSGSKVYGTLTGVYVEGDLSGSVFSDDSTLLVDGLNGVLRGTHIGSLQGTVDTGGINLYGNTIAGISTNEDIFISPVGTGNVNIPTTLRAGTINLTNDPVSGGLTVVAATNTARQVTISGAYNDVASSSSGGYSINFSRSRGTPSAQLPLQVGDELSTTIYTGLTGSLGYRAAAAVIVKTGTTVSDGVITGDLALAVNDGTGPTPTVRLTIKQDGVVRFDSPTLTAVQVNTGAVATYLKVNIGGTDYAIPAYALV